MFKRYRDWIDVVPFDEGVLVVVGGVTLSLDREAAEKLALLLADAVEMDGAIDFRQIDCN